MVLTCIDDLNWLTFIIIQFILQKNVGGSNLSQFSSGKSVETSLKAYYKEFKKVKKYSFKVELSFAFTPYIWLFFA